eukprot:CAMPEP_0197558690 /NCGR_PEP_ID=MMETSP1320-20131121/19751_1 /TAXON_ID=91990 /ORGANISM="Bolidomonas sp., Strain RCC2347" /LENGTH=51 /DNA_ID=CAMNT_0043120025 /DNA_START=59 /DNA_END=210 /DNA_ORIENTATION=-
MPSSISRFASSQKSLLSAELTAASSDPSRHSRCTNLRLSSVRVGMFGSTLA